MKDLPKDKTELVAAARIAMDRPEQDGFWNRLAEYFEGQREAVAATIQPRPSKEL